MSAEATRWAIEEARVPGHLFGVLVCLAWKADEAGRGAYPSEATLSDWTGKSARQVRSDLRALQADGFVVPGDQSLVEHIPADRRPAVRDLAMPARDDATEGSKRPAVSFPPEVHDRSSASVRDRARPEVQRHDGGKPTSANKSLIDKPSNSRKREEYDDPRFAELWTAYPRKAGKRAAWRAWLAAENRGADLAAIVKAALRFAEQRAGQDPKFTPHPATWLNGARYDDEGHLPATGDKEDDSWLR